VAIYCGDKGLAVAGVRADMRQKRPARRYVVLGFEVVTDAGYQGPSRTPAAVLTGMLQRSEALTNVLTADGAAYVVSEALGVLPDGAQLRRHRQDRRVQDGNGRARM
jgi:hypothetical protein